MLESSYNGYEELIQLAKDKYECAERLLLTEVDLLDHSFNNSLSFTGSYAEALKKNRLDADHFHPRYDDLRSKIIHYDDGYLKLMDITTLSEEKINNNDELPRDTDYIELSCVDSNIGIIKRSRKIGGNEIPSRAKMILLNGDVVASSVKGSINKVGLINDRFENSIGSTGFFIFRTDYVENEYLLALIKNIIISEQMKCEASGTILSAVNSKKLQNIIVPNLSESKRSRISALIKCSHSSYWKSMDLVKNAQKSINIALESGEENAIEFLARNNENISV